MHIAFETKESEEHIVAQSRGVRSEITSHNSIHVPPVQMILDRRTPYSAVVCEIMMSTNVVATVIGLTGEQTPVTQLFKRNYFLQFLSLINCASIQQCNKSFF